MLKTRKIFSIFVALVLAVAVSFSTAAFAAPSDRSDQGVSAKARVESPLNLAILIQDDLVARVGNELNVTRDFIRSLPAGSRVMIGYVTSGTLQVRQPFTSDLERAAAALRLPISSTAASAYNPYVEVIEALRHFNSEGKGRNALLLISDGLDTSRGFDVTSAANTIDLHRAINEAQRRNVAVYSFYAPSVGLTSWNRTAAIYGQSSLNRLSNETGGRAFFQGTSFVTFDSYFENLRRTLNDQRLRAY
ncbi:MAG TPA: hypothetical protein VD966_02660 [Pyrinomonadaceae bacterium]|nr:hypothetical protein [Pyrinomonadaceae bacterium]